jgi:hypothetical protein
LGVHLVFFLHITSGPESTSKGRNGRAKVEVWRHGWLRFPRRTYTSGLCGLIDMASRVAIHPFFGEYCAELLT